MRRRPRAGCRTPPQVGQRREHSVRCFEQRRRAPLPDGAALLTQLGGTAGHLFLGRLEDEPGLARQVDVAECPCRSQSDGRMHVVSASVHHSRGQRHIRWVRFLLNWESVEIRPKPDSRARSGANLSDDPGAFRAHSMVDSPVIEVLCHLAGGAMLGPPDLRVLMEVTPHSDHAGCDFRGQGAQAQRFGRSCRECSDIRFRPSRGVPARHGVPD